MAKEGLGMDRDAILTLDRTLSRPVLEVFSPRQVE